MATKGDTSDLIDLIIKPKVGFICSCFDYLHAGHIDALEQASRQCEHLIVGLQSDPTIDRSEKERPTQGLFERYTQLKAVRYINEIVPYSTEKDLDDLLKVIQPDIRFLGEDYKDKKFTGDYLDIEIFFLNRKHSWSSSALRRKMK
jgi:glycerol-3-phosphate cytidylyltransferase